MIKVDIGIAWKGMETRPRCRAHAIIGFHGKSDTWWICHVWLVRNTSPSPFLKAFPKVFTFQRFHCRWTQKDLLKRWLPRFVLFFTVQTFTTTLLISESGPLRVQCLPHMLGVYIAVSKMRQDSFLTLQQATITPWLCQCILIVTPEYIPMLVNLGHWGNSVSKTNTCGRKLTTLR